MTDSTSAAVSDATGTPTAVPVTGKPSTRVRAVWNGEMRFDGHRELGGPSIRLDGHGVTGPSPVDSLLLSLASCAGIDVVEILAKRRTPVQSLEVAVVGERAATVPSRVTSVHLTFHIGGVDVDRAHADRAIELAINKYCSVKDSLDPNMPVRWTLLLNGV